MSSSSKRKLSLYKKKASTAKKEQDSEDGKPEETAEHKGLERILSSGGSPQIKEAFPGSSTFKRASFATNVPSHLAHLYRNTPDSRATPESRVVSTTPGTSAFISAKDTRMGGRAEYSPPQS